MILQSGKECFISRILCSVTNRKKIYNKNYIFMYGETSNGLLLVNGQQYDLHER